MPAARVWQQGQVAHLSSYVQPWITVRVCVRIRQGLRFRSSWSWYFEGVYSSSNFNIIALDHKKKLKNKYVRWKHRTL